MPIDPADIVAPEPAAGRRPAAITVALCALLALLWFGNIGSRVLTEPDEGRYAEVPREMLASGDWVVPHLNGIQYLEKPPLQYWATAALFRALGVEPWVSRLWTTGLGFACILLVWWAGRRLYGAPAGRAGALVLASGPLFFFCGHLNTLDMGLTFLLSAAVVAFLEAQRAAPGSGRERHAMWLTWLLVALATLQKGVVALALPAFALVLYTLVERDLALWRRLHLGAGLAIVLALNVPWWAAVQQRNSQFLQFFFVHEHFQRFATTEHQRAEPWWFLAAVLLAGTLPWIAPTARALVSAWHAAPAAAAGAGRSLRSERFLILWAAAIFLFYSPSGSKLAPYILPMMPPLALLAGRELARWQERSEGARALRSTLLISAVMAGALLAVGAVFAQVMPPGFKREVYLAVARYGALAGALIALATVAAAVLARRGSLPGATAALGLGLTAGLACLTSGTNALEPWRGGPYIARYVAPVLGPRTPFYCVGTYPQTLTFALRRTCVAVGYYGELEIRFDDGGRNFIPTYAQFVAIWRGEPDAVAVVDPQAWPGLQALGIPATILFRDPNLVVIAKAPH